MSPSLPLPMAAPLPPTAFTVLLSIVMSVLPLAPLPLPMPAPGLLVESSEESRELTDALRMVM